MTAPAPTPSSTVPREPDACPCGGFYADPPAPRACVKCQRIKIVPRHTEWSRTLKRWLLWDLVRSSRMTWMTPQAWWERLLVRAFQGRSIAGKMYPWAIGADDVYLAAVKVAERWEAEGGKFDVG